MLIMLSHECVYRLLAFGVKEYAVSNLVVGGTYATMQSEFDFDVVFDISLKNVFIGFELMLGFYNKNALDPDAPFMSELM